MRVRLVVGDPDELSGLHLQRLARRPDAAGAAETIKHVLSGVDGALDAVFGAGDDLARANDAERVGAPALLGNIMKALDEFCRLRPCAFYTNLGAIGPFPRPLRSDKLSASTTVGHGSRKLHPGRCASREPALEEPLPTRRTLTMPIAMSAEEAGRYARDGCLLRKGLLSLEEVERFRAARPDAARTGAARRLGHDEGRQRGQDDAPENVDQGRRTTSTDCWRATNAWWISRKTPSASRSTSTVTR